MLGVTCFLLGICATKAVQTVYYNKAMDAWVKFNANKEKAKRETEDRAFEEFNGDGTK
jgi:hypothetical protein